MTTHYSKLAAALSLSAAVLAAAVPAPASARPCDDDHHPGPAAEPVPYYPPAPAGWVGERGGDRDGGGWRGHDGWRDPDFRRAREIREVRLELRRLDAERAAFHARFGWNERRIARYERSYLWRRAELERRLERLAYYAWR